MKLFDHWEYYEDDIIKLETIVKKSSDDIFYNPNDYHNFLVRAQAEFELGDLEYALTDILVALNLKSDYDGAYRLRGLVYYKNDENENAITDFTKAIQLGPNYFDYFFRGIINLDIDNYDKSIEDFSILINNNSKEMHHVSPFFDDILLSYTPDFFKKYFFSNYKYLSYYHRGEAYLSLNNFFEASEDFTRSLEINPQFYFALCKRGLAKKGLEEYTNAIEDFTRAIEINPDYTVAYLNRGKVKVILGDLKAAIEDFTQAIKIDPYCASAFSCRGNARYSLGDLKGAEDDFSSSRDIGEADDFIDAYPDYHLENITRDSPRLYLYIGVTKYNSEKLLDAIKWYTKAIDLKDDYARAYNYRGQAKYELNDFEGAILDLSKAIDINPKLSSAYNYRGQAKYGLNDFEGAILDLTKAIDINPGLSSAYTYRGHSKMKIGEVEDAKEDYRWVDENPSESGFDDEDEYDEDWMDEDYILW